MRSTWLEILDCVLRPARPHLERCRSEREHHLVARRLFAEERVSAIANCERRIHDARAAVFATDDGVVGSRMTDLERTWRRLSRPDPEAAAMDLWARVVPASWLDRKRWRDSAPAAWLDAAIALAADIENVEAAEAAIDALRAALAARGNAIGSRIRWRFYEEDSENAIALLAEPLRAARDACPERHRVKIFERAARVEQSVHGAALARIPERPRLARDLAHAAFVDFVWRGASLGDASPVTALRALWKTGYVLSNVDASSVTLEIPPLEDF